MKIKLKNNLLLKQILKGSRICITTMTLYATMVLMVKRTFNIGWFASVSTVIFIWFLIGMIVVLLISIKKVIEGLLLCFKLPITIKEAEDILKKPVDTVYEYVKAINVLIDAYAKKTNKKWNGVTSYFVRKDVQNFIIENFGIVPEFKYYGGFFRLSSYHYRKGEKMIEIKRKKEEILHLEDQRMEVRRSVLSINYCRKSLVIGPSGCGKTRIVLRYCILHSHMDIVIVSGISDNLIANMGIRKELETIGREIVYVKNSKDINNIPWNRKLLIIIPGIYNGAVVQEVIGRCEETGKTQQVFLDEAHYVESSLIEIPEEKAIISRFYQNERNINYPEILSTNCKLIIEN